MSALLYIKLPSSGISSNFVWGCIRPNSMLVAHDKMTLPSWLVTWNVTSCNIFCFWVYYKHLARSNNLYFFCGCMSSQLLLLLGSSFVHSGSLYINLYTLMGSRFNIRTSANFGPEKLDSPSVGLQFIFYVCSQMLWFVLHGSLFCRLSLEL